MIRHHERIARAAALTLALTAIATPPALATPASSGPCSEVCSAGSYGPGPSRPAATPASTGPRSDVSSTNGYDSARVPPAVVRVVAGDSGFDWGDAGIGAAGGIALSMVGLGGALAVSQSRARRTRRTTALPS